MSLPYEYLLSILESKDEGAALGVGKDLSWAIIDGALVIYDLEDQPKWLPPRDEDGNSIVDLPAPQARCYAGRKDTC